jgi:hypothetical protein
MTHTGTCKFCREQLIEHSLDEIKKCFYANSLVEEEVDE